MTPKATTRVHQWVKWQVSPVVVIVDPFTGDPVAVTLADTEVGEQVACQLCSEPLTEYSAESSCEGGIELP